MNTQPILGVSRIGQGPRRVIVLNDWLSDSSSWTLTWPILDETLCTWGFADLRGYGKSRALTGAYTVVEAADDVLRLADSLGWGRFSIVGHSMSSLVALHLAQQVNGRIEKTVVLTPPPPAGLGADPATVQFLQALAEGSDEARLAGLALMWGERLGPGWRAFKARQWRNGAATAAASAYVAMFAQTGLPDTDSIISSPVLAVSGEEDADLMRAAAVAGYLGGLCRDLRVEPLVGCGHYPMQECPPRLVECLERFLCVSGPEAAA